jgi:DNA-binding transcriptional regulator YdaS (Cro superfamily)
LYTYARIRAKGQIHPRNVARRPSVSLTPAESAGLRASLKNLRQIHGSWAALARLFGVSDSTVRKVANARTAGSPGLVVLTARLAGIGVERILAPGHIDASKCPTCGAVRGAP